MKLFLVLTMLIWEALIVGQATASPSLELPLPHELTLKKCVEIALEHNPDLRQASEQFLAVQGQVIQLHAILYPTLNSQVISTPLTFYVQINQTLYSRAIAPQLQLSRLSEQQVFINYRQKLNDIVFQVRQAFTNALGAREQARLWDEFSTRKTESVKMAQQFFEAGHAQRSEMTSIQVQANLAEQNKANADLSFTQAKLLLDTLLGVELPSSVALVGDLKTDYAPAQLDADALSAEALRHRPDLQLLASIQLSAAQQIKIEQKNAYPIAGFSSNSAFQPPALGPGGGFDLERNYDDPSTQRVAGNTQLPLTFYVNWLIFDGGGLAGAKMSTEAAIASREVALVQLRQSIPGEVSAAVAAILIERRTLKALTQAGSPTDVRHAAEIDVEAGRMRQLDKVNLENDIFQQEQVRLNSQVRLSLATAALDHALGRGLDAPLTPQRL